VYAFVDAITKIIRKYMQGNSHMDNTALATNQHMSYDWLHLTDTDLVLELKKTLS